MIKVRMSSTDKTGKEISVTADFNNKRSESYQENEEGFKDILGYTCDNFTMYLCQTIEKN